MTQGKPGLGDHSKRHSTACIWEGTATREKSEGYNHGREYTCLVRVSGGERF